ncbi:MAG TPA: DoxX family protein [Thermoanaerobaculia bacterium]|jgi:uncharacterized membrane protein|nr:DoxX family protein [Thermoanaerobaculia bacterium]
MDATRIGRVLFAVDFAALGVLSLIAGDFALVWQPVPQGVPWREPLAYASGCLLLACGIGMLLPRTRRLATLVMTVNLLLWLLLLRLPPLAAKPANASLWLGLGETLMLVTGAWILFATLASRGGGPAGDARAQDVRWARRLYALALPMVGLSHFVYLRGTAAMIPEWIPFHEGFAGLTGAAHIAAGLAILLAVLARLAATLEAIMISLFTVLVCVPMIVAAPATRLPWTAFFISAALAGAAWAVAGSLPGAELAGQGGGSSLPSRTQALPSTVTVASAKKFQRT